jgi:hypothetical protein
MPMRGREPAGDATGGFRVGVVHYDDHAFAAPAMAQQLSNWRTGLAQSKPHLTIGIYSETADSAILRTPANFLPSYGPTACQRAEVSIRYTPDGPIVRYTLYPQKRGPASLAIESAPAHAQASEPGVFDALVEQQARLRSAP